MNIFFHELKRELKTTTIWTISLAAVIALLVFMFPSLKDSMNEMTAMFQNMGAFSQMFNLGEVNMGTPMGYYGLEVGNAYGICGAIFAAMLGFKSISKEFSNKTAEFLFTHPVKRVNVLAQKLASTIVQIVLMNLVVFATGYLSFQLIGESLDFKTFAIYHLSLFLMMLQISIMSFGVSCFLKKNSFGISIGVALLLYFADLVSNLTKDVEFLKYFTSFSFASTNDIIKTSNLKWEYVATNFVIAIGIAIIGIFAFRKRDI